MMGVEITDKGPSQSILILHEAQSIAKQGYSWISIHILFPMVIIVIYVKI